MGAVMPRSRITFGCLVPFLVLFAALLVAVWLNPPPGPDTSRGDGACRADLACWAGRHIGMASVKCRAPIERLAKNSFQWTDSVLEPRFSRYRWKDDRTGELTYIGDHVKFQNDFGAWIFYSYECDISASGDAVTDVRAKPGRLNSEPVR